MSFRVVLIHFVKQGTSSKIQVERLGSLDGCFDLTGLKQTTETTPALSSALSYFEINLKLISKSLSAILSAAQRKMSSRFLFDPFKGRIGNATTFCAEFC